MLLPVYGCLFAIDVVFASIPVIIGMPYCLVAMYSLVLCIVSCYMLFSGFILCTSKACMLMKMWSCICTAVQYFPCCLDWYLLASCVGTSMPFSVFVFVNSVCVCVCVCVWNICWSSLFHSCISCNSMIATGSVFSRTCLM